MSHSETNNIAEQVPHVGACRSMSTSRFPKCLRVMAEYGSSGIWVAEPRGLFRHAMIGHRKLGLPAELADRFDAWIDKYWARADRKPLDVDAFNKEGRSLAVALKRFVGPHTKVIFEPELENGGLGRPEIIETVERSAADAELDVEDHPRNDGD